MMDQEAAAPLEQETTDDDVESAPTTNVEQTSVIQQLFGSEVETLIECRCGWSTTTKRTELLFSLFYQHPTGSCTETCTCVHVCVCL